MPLGFDNLNLLAEGIHDATLDEVLSTFGGNSRRDKLCDNLRQYMDGLALTGWNCEVLIDGSFVMPAVREPNDIDLILVLPDDWDSSRRDFRPFEYNTLAKSRTKTLFKIEVIPVLPGSEEYHSYFSLFTQVRVEWCQELGLPEGTRKGLVRVRP